MALSSIWTLFALRCQVNFSKKLKLKEPLWLVQFQLFEKLTSTN